MKKSQLYILVGLLLCSHTLLAQRLSDTHITGHVVDVVTKEHLPYATIAVKGTTIGAATDGTGHYLIRNMAAGQYTLVATAVGYRPQEKTVTVTDDKHFHEADFELSEDQIMLDAVVVTANKGESTRREASNIVSIMSPKLFENTNSVCLAQGLNFQSGVRIENNCQNCGFQQVRINGLEGPYTQILIDSRPVFSALAGVYGIEQIPVNMIDRVEIIRGGGSALYGSNAIAGTINILTKEPLYNTVSINNNTQLIGGSALDINNMVNAAIVSEEYKMGVSLYASYRNRGAYDANGDGFTEIGLLNAHTMGFRSYFKTSHQSKLTLEYHSMNEFRRGGNNLHLPAHNADITEQTEHNINSGSVKYDWFTADYKHRIQAYASSQYIYRQSYYGSHQNPNAYGNTTDLTAIVGGHYIYAMENCWFMPANLTVGVEQNYNALKDEMLGYNRVLKQAVYTGSLFAQNEWVNSRWNFLVGMRMDKHNLIKNPIVSPRVNVRYNPTSWVSLRTGYASGFRAPQAFDEDLHIKAVGGGVSLIQLANDLKTESSHSVNLSADFNHTFGQVQTNLLVELFYTHLDNVFILDPLGTNSSGNLIFERRNGDGAIIRGVNVEGKVIPSPKWYAQVGATLQKSNYTVPEVWSENVALEPHTTMFRAPNLYGYVMATYNPIKALGIALNGVYTGSMLVQHFAGAIANDREVRTPDFFDLGIKVSYDFKVFKNNTLQLHGSIANIFDAYQKDFDKGINRDASYIYGPSAPRSYSVGVKLLL